MAYDDFFKMLEETGNMIISKELFHTLLESQMSGKITAEEKKRLYDEGYFAGYKMGMFDFGKDKELKGENKR